MSYKDFEIEDFLADKEFIEWVKSPTMENEVFWHKWIELHPGKRETIDRAREIVQSVKYPKYEAGEEKAQKILGNIIAQNYSRRNIPKVNTTNKKRTISRQLYFGSVAAAILILITVSIYYFNMMDAPNAKIDSLTQITKSNPRGQRSTIILPDSSVVQLNSESEISYFTDFSSNREVQLSGEAFFSVKKGTVPFRVHTQHLTTTVLGTKFNVKAFTEEQYESVSLVEGSVKVENSQNDQIETSFLEHGERLVYDDKEKVTYLNELDADELAWKDGYLVFNNTDVSEFTHLLRRWYGVEVTILGNPNSQWEINGKYKTYSLELLLESIKFTENIDYRIKNKTVELILN